MVCLSCLEAGAIMRFIHQGDGSNPLGLTTNLEQQALMLHSECKGGTWCDCQHELFGINELLVK
jgi:hypothetical protein